MKNKSLVLLFFVLVIGAFLRLYKIDKYMTFLGDEGRDVTTVRRLLVEGHPPLIGPGTSIGNMYLGPIYYYYMAPWLLAANFSPVGPAVGVALLGVATIFLVWWVSRKWFGEWAAFIASFLYAIAPTIVIYSRSSWNPNIMPFFALLSIVSIWKVWKEKSYWWMIVLGCSYAFVLQSHYLGLLLVPVFLVFWLITFKEAKIKRYLILNTIYSILFFCVLMSPMVIFDFRHNFQNFKSIEKFFAQRQETVSARPWNAIPQAWPLLQKISSRVLTGRDTTVGVWTALLFLLPILWILGIGKKINFSGQEKSGFLILLAWIGFALLGLGVYKQEIYDHYFGFIFPLPFLLIGGITQTLIDNVRRRGISLVIVGFAILVFVNLSQNPLKYPPDMQLQRTIKVSDKLIEITQHKPFNMSLIAERNYDAAYKYFLLVKKVPVVDIDAQNTKDTIKDQLFVICELEEKKCDPTHNPKAEIANFGWSKIENEWNVDGVTIFKLVHAR